MLSSSAAVDQSVTNSNSEDSHLSEEDLDRQLSIYDLLLDTTSGHRRHEVSVETQQEILASVAESSQSDIGSGSFHLGRSFRDDIDDAPQERNENKQRPQSEWTKQYLQDPECAIEDNELKPPSRARLTTFQDDDNVEDDCEFVDRLEPAKETGRVNNQGDEGEKKISPKKSAEGNAVAPSDLIRGLTTLDPDILDALVQRAGITAAESHTSEEKKSPSSSEKKSADGNAVAPSDLVRGLTSLDPDILDALVQRAGITTTGSHTNGGQKSSAKQTGGQNAVAPSDLIRGLTTLDPDILDALVQRAGITATGSHTSGEKTSSEKKSADGNAVAPRDLILGLTSLDPAILDTLVARAGTTTTESGKNGEQTSSKKTGAVAPRDLIRGLTSLDPDILDALVERAGITREGRTNEEDVASSSKDNSEEGNGSATMDLIRGLTSLDPTILDALVERAGIRWDESLGSQPSDTHDLLSLLETDGSTGSSSQRRIRREELASEAAITVEMVRGIVGAHAITGNRDSSSSTPDDLTTALWRLHMRRGQVANNNNNNNNNQSSNDDSVEEEQQIGLQTEIVVEEAEESNNMRELNDSFILVDGQPVSVVEEPINTRTKKERRERVVILLVILVLVIGASLGLVFGLRNGSGSSSSSPTSPPNVTLSNSTNTTVEIGDAKTQPPVENAREWTSARTLDGLSGDEFASSISVSPTNDSVVAIGLAGADLVLVMNWRTDQLIGSPIESDGGVGDFGEIGRMVQLINTTLAVGGSRAIRFFRFSPIRNDWERVGQDINSTRLLPQGSSLSNWHIEGMSFTLTADGSVVIVVSSRMEDTGEVRSLSLEGVLDDNTEWSQRGSEAFVLDASSSSSSLESALVRQGSVWVMAHNEPTGNGGVLELFQYDKVNRAWTVQLRPNVFPTEVVSLNVASHNDGDDDGRSITTVLLQQQNSLVLLDVDNDSFTVLNRLHVSDVNALLVLGERFGDFAVGLSGNGRFVVIGTSVVGVLDAYAVRMFEWDRSEGGSFVQASGGGTSSFFGDIESRDSRGAQLALSYNGSVVFVGLPFMDDTGNTPNAGALYVYEQTER